MIPHLLPFGVGASESAVKAIEEKISAPLPSDYRMFLLTTNGARPIDGVVLCFHVKWNDQPWAKHFSYGCLSTLDGTDNVPGQSLSFAYSDTVFTQVRALMPNDTIPIGGDLGENAILLGISGPNRGKVFFWVNDYAPLEDDAEPTYDNVGFVANSFTEFLEGLYPWSEAPE